ncbi:MAG: hypothetical protein AAF824_10110 [Bacteroidota bacterium]
MNNNKMNLWPELDLTKISTPAMVLKEQAEFLSNNTDNILNAFIKSSVTDSNGNYFETTHPIKHEFVIIAPQLKNYSYELFYVVHGLDIYPLEIFWSDQKYKPLYTVRNEADFMESLKQIFADPKTFKVIQALYTHMV